MGAMIRGHDWASTPIGTPDRWPQSLRTALSILLHSGYPMYVAWGPQFTQFYNDAYRPILGATKHPHALGRGTPETFAEIWDFIGPMFREVLERGTASTYTDQLLALDRNNYREEAYFTFSYSAIPDDDLGIGGVFVTVLETTEQVLRERRSRTLGDLLDVPPHSSRAEICTAAAAILGRNPHDIPFVRLYELMPDRTLLLRASTGADDDRALPGSLDLSASGLPWALGEAVRSGKLQLVDNREPAVSCAAPVWPEPVESLAVVPLVPRGQEQPALVLVVGVSPRRAFDDDYREFIQSVGAAIVSVLTEAEAFATERRRAEALSEIDRAKTAFFSNVSHEFRTPLTLMLGPLEDMLNAPLPEPGAARERLETAHRNGLRLLRLVNTLLDFSRIEAGRMQASYEPVDLALTTRDLASSFRAACERVGLELAIDCPPLPAPVHVDRDMWEKVVLNLVSNAFKFTFAGRILVSVRAETDAAVLRVQDTGIGIAAEELQKIFERFHRVEGAGGRTHEGSGIGLALVQELVRLHGGAIRVDSEPGQGTTFTVRIPFGTDHLPADRIQAPRTLPSTQTAANAYVEEALRWSPGLDDAAADLAELAARDGPLQPWVLVADDNADMRTYLARILATRFRVRTVADGEAALSDMEREPPDLVLADVMMPRLDGFGLLRAIRSDARWARLPVILLSARAGEEARIEGIDAGADDYLVKPFAARELLARVSANLQLAKARERAALAIGESQSRLAFALRAGGLGYWERDLVNDVIVASEIDKTNWGLSPGQEMSAEVLSERMHPDDRDRHREAMDAAIAGGEPMEIEYRVQAAGGMRWLRVTGQTVYSQDGTPLRMAGTSLDITARKQTEESLREETRTLEILNRTGAALAGDLDLERIVQTVTDAATELSGAQFGAFFYNVTDEAGDSYTLYTISGAPREAFSSFPMPRNTAVFDPTFRGLGMLRSDDIRRDPRYGQNAPYRGMPDGHLPVVSYLAVPVVSRSGEVIGGLFFGHGEPGMFTERGERIVSAIAAQAAIAIDNARLFASAQRELAERRRIEKHQDLLLAELNHRVKNTLAIVLAIATQTLRHSDTAEVFRTGFEARIMALSEAHNLLTESNWEGASFRDIVERVLGPYRGEGPPRYTVTADEDARVGPRTAVAMVMALHELATNAAKYGALSSSHGVVEVSWRVESAPEPRLLVEWRESGGPPVRPPSRTGFGSRLVRGLSEDAFGSVELDFVPSGLMCTFALPLTLGNRQ
jgi:signal transduction histidine kinase/FixJ family two-component response regulator